MEKTRLVIYMWGFALLVALGLTLSGCADSGFEIEQPGGEITSGAETANSDEEVAPHWSLTSADGQTHAGRARSSCWNITDDTNCPDYSPEPFDPEVAVMVASGEPLTFTSAFANLGQVVVDVYDENQVQVESKTFPEPAFDQLEFVWQPSQVPGNYFVLVTGIWEGRGAWAGEFSLTLAGNEPQGEAGYFPLPQFKLVSSDGSLVEGQQMSSCWPQEDGVGLCIDTLPPVFEEDNVVNIVGRQITVDVEAERLPDNMYLSLIVQQDDQLEWVIEESVNSPDQQVTWEPDVLPGDYILLVSGGWQNVGDAGNAFSIRLE